MQIPVTVEAIMKEFAAQNAAQSADLTTKLVSVTVQRDALFQEVQRLKAELDNINPVLKKAAEAADPRGQEESKKDS